MKTACPETALLGQLCEGRVDSGEAETLIAHIDRCETCRVTLDQMGQAADFFRELSPNRADLALPDSIRERLERIKIEGRQRHPEQGVQPMFADVAPWIRPSDNCIGEIGEYSLLQCIGRGGMGVVFLALDRKLRRRVALKLLSPVLLDDRAAQRRFLREARLAAGINHPCVVAVHSVEFVRELPYLVTEFVEGESLDQRLRRVGTLPLRSTIEITRQVAEGLGAAHDAGIVHRDVKPANILLLSGTDRVKLTDFGLARATADSSLTRTGTVLGTPGFLAPEQLQNSSNTVDQRTDLFSLGCVAYLLCTGKSPFESDTIGATLHNVCKSTPPQVDALNTQIPRWFAALIAQLLEKSPEARPQDAQTIANVLSNKQREEPSLGVRRSTRASSVGVAAHQPADRMQRAIGLRALFVVAASTLLFLFVLAILPTSQAVVDSSDALQEMLTTTDSPITLTLGARGPFVIRPAEFEDRELELVAAPGIAPVIQIEMDSSEDEPGLFFFDSRVHMEGLTVELIRSTSNRRASGFDGEESPPLIACERGQFTARDCRFVARRSGPCIDLEATDCRVSNCELLASHGSAIVWRTDENDRLQLVDSVVMANTALEIEQLGDAELLLDRCTLFGRVAVCVNAEDAEGCINATVHGCVVDASQEMLRVEEFDHEGDLEPEDAFQELLTWSGSGNVLPPRLLSVIDEDDVTRLRSASLAGLRNLGATEVKSKQLRPTYKLNRHQLTERLLSSTLTGRHLAGGHLARVQNNAITHER